MKYISLPLNSDLFETINDNSETFILNTKQINFENVDDQVTTALIYIRNLQLNIQLDFIDCDYKKKEEWILKYLNSDLLLDKGLYQLDETILTILANEDIGLNCILSQEEIKLFREDNKEVVENCLKFLISINIVMDILERNKDSEEISYSFYNGKIIENKPLFYETIKHLIILYPYICDAIRLYFMNQYEEVLYSYTIKNVSKQFGFYKAILGLPSVKFSTLI